MEQMSEGFNSGDAILILPGEEALQGPEQMALDELLLFRARGCVMRVYCWAGKAVTFGYFQRWTEAREAFPHVPLTRRWTGGGMVPHGEDFTFSVVAARGQALAEMRARDSYETIHRAVAEVLRESGKEDVEIASVEICHAACFQGAAPGDVLWRGKKVCGGAQRRTREGLLYQGSVQMPVEADFAQRLAGRLFGNYSVTTPDETLLNDARKMAAEKYATEGWTRRR